MTQDWRFRLRNIQSQSQFGDQRSSVSEECRVLLALLIPTDPRCPLQTTRRLFLDQHTASTEPTVLTFSCILHFRLLVIHVHSASGSERGGKRERERERERERDQIKSDVYLYRPLARYKERERQRERDRQTDRQTDRQADRQTDRDRDTERERKLVFYVQSTSAVRLYQRDRQTDRQTDRDRV